MSINYQQELNEEQLDAVWHGDGPCLVLAGAGSGKTRTLVYRVAYLLEQGVAPDNILLVTFTNKAAKEMLGRVVELFGMEPEGIWGGTFHHIGNRLLRRYADRLGYNRNFSILDAEDSVDLLKAVMKNNGVDTNGKTFPKPAIVESIIGLARNRGVELAEIVAAEYAYPATVTAKITQIAEEYATRKKATNAMDFDDLLVNWLAVLRTCPEIKQKLATDFKYILVDEYQDTNYIQAEIIRELASVHGNVLAVGDDSQSIYSFRAADVGNILNFPRVFPGAKVFRIEKNYRSTPSILALANASIAHNRTQFEKTLIPARDGGSLPALSAARDERQEASLVARRIERLRQGGLDYRRLAVLYRSNFQSAEIQLELSRRNIPYVVRGGQRFFEQAHVKDMVAYFRLVANYRDELAWRRVLLLADGVGEKSVEKILAAVRESADWSAVKNLQPALSAPATRGWRGVVELLSDLQELLVTEGKTLGDLVEKIMQAGYESHLKNAYDNYRDRLDDLNQFMSFVARYRDLAALLADVLLSEDYRRGDTAAIDAVILSTVHQAKGLEWPVVVLLGFHDGQVPHQRSLDHEAKLEEERRLFYVAVTRAKDELNLSYPVRSFSFKFGEVYAKPSLFLRELPTGSFLTTEISGPPAGFSDEDDEVIYYD